MEIFSVTSLLLFTLLFLLFAYVYRMSRSHGTFKKMGVPGPRPWPLFGNFLQEMRQGIVHYYRNLCQEFKGQKVMGYCQLDTPILIVRDLDMIRDIVVKKFHCFVNHRQFPNGEPGDHALTQLKDEHWKRVRSIVSPTFSTARLRRMYPHIERNTKLLLENLQEKLERNEEMELKHVMSCYTMDNIASTGYGVQINSLKDENNQFMKSALNIINSIGATVILYFFFPFLWPMFQYLGIGGLPRDSVGFLQKFIDSAMASRKEGNLSERDDFLGLLMRSEDDDVHDDNMSEEEAKALGVTPGEKKGKLSHLDVQGQAFIFFLAGYETVSTVMSFTLYLMAMNPDCCRKVQQEIDTHLKGQLPTYDSVHKLTYLDMCVHESMRLYPPGFILDRVCTEDTEIQGVHIPKGMVINIPVSAIYNDPDLWAEPEKFDPLRFTPEAKASRHPCAFMPFGEGPRKCIAQRLALLEVRVGLAAILGRMTPVPCSKTSTEIKLKNFNMEAVGGLWIKLEKRK